MKKKFITTMLTTLMFLIITCNTLPVFAAPNDLSLNQVIQNIEEYDSKIEYNIDKLDKCKEQIVKKEDAVKKNGEKLVEAQQKSQEKNELLSERLGSVYMHGGFETTTMQYLDALFSSGNLVEVAKKAQIISEVCKSDKKLVLDAKELEEKFIYIKTSVKKEEKGLKKDKLLLEKEIQGLEDQKQELLKYLQENSQLLSDGASSIFPIELPADMPDQPREIIGQAQKYLGIPYLWGGVSPDGFDCSGLLQYVFKSQNIDIPRVSQDQQRFAKPISIAEIKPGDLVFNKDSESTHVGMYVGDDKYIQAPHTGDVVKISKWSTSNMKYIGRILD